MTERMSKETVDLIVNANNHTYDALVEALNTGDVHGGTEELSTVELVAAHNLLVGYTSGLLRGLATGTDNNPIDVLNDTFTYLTPDMVTRAE